MISLFPYFGIDTSHRIHATLFQHLESFGSVRVSLRQHFSHLLMTIRLHFTPAGSIRLESDFRDLQ